MPSVSNIAIGANMAAAAANKARHGMNESIARLSTGIRAMYGSDAAGHSMGKNIQAVGASYAQASRNIEDGISATVEWYKKYENELKDIKFKYDYEK